MSTQCLLNRFLVSFADRDHASATDHRRSARTERWYHRHIGRATRIERDCAKREADAAELRDLAGTDIPHITQPRDPRGER
jgi:hypothetical protein